MVEKTEVKVEGLLLVSPVVDLHNKERANTIDFLNKEFFEFV